MEFHMGGIWAPGFELYQGITSEYYGHCINEQIGAPARRRLDMRKTLNSLKSRYYIRCCD